jgi:molecular chaperone GrpE
MADMHEDGEESLNGKNQGNPGEHAPPDIPQGSERSAGQAPPLPDTETQLKDLNDKYLRLAADFENYKKRMERDLNTHIRYAVEKFAVDLIEVVDNLDRALASESGPARGGIEQISKLFNSILARHGIQPVESIGKKFNPAEHEAVLCIPSDREEGVVIGEACKGYRMHDKIIRCAKVTVSKGQESE